MPTSRKQPAAPGLFEACGIEIEYQIVGAATLDPLPLADALLRRAAGGRASSAIVGDLVWSNELAMHLIEFKVGSPVASLEGWAERFQRGVNQANDWLAPMGATLLPSGAHPWMNPGAGTRLWPHAQARIYRRFDRIFGCRSHGWANLQSMHLNLSFRNDEEFARLHAAVRLLLPLLPALAASSPYREGRFTGWLDGRMEAYGSHTARVPEVAGRLIPEAVYTEQAYRDRVLDPMYRAIAPLDPRGELRYEWLNARGAIARFDRGSIEIRVLDTQECPAADLAVAWAVVHVLKDLVAERWMPAGLQRRRGVMPLRRLLLRTMREAEDATVDDAFLLRAFGYPGSAPCSAGALWAHLLDACVPPLSPFAEALDLIREEGSLACRLLKAAGRNPGRARLRSVYGALRESLARGRLFVP